MHEAKQVSVKPYIMFVGIDGSGKTVISKAVASELNYFWTKEPHYLKITSSLTPTDQLITFAYDRYLHMDLIKEKLIESPIIQDRGFICNMAYQSLNTFSIQEILKFQTTKLIFPTKIIYLNTPLDTCIQRIRHRNETYSRGDLLKIINTYKQILTTYFKNTHLIIDTHGKTIEELKLLCIDYILGVS